MKDWFPPKSHSLMTDFDPALIQKIPRIPERQGELGVQHHRKADDVRSGLEIPKWAVFVMPRSKISTLPFTPEFPLTGPAGPQALNSDWYMRHSARFGKNMSQRRQ